MTSLYKALRLWVIYGSHNPLDVIELRERSGNISILSSTIYRELSEHSLLADNVFVEELCYTFHILILKGLGFHPSRYILLSNSQVSEPKMVWRHKHNIHRYLLPQGGLLYRVHRFFFLSQLSLLAL